MNSYMRTPTGMSVVINSKPHTISDDHPRYSEIVEAVRDRQWDKVVSLISVEGVMKPITEAVEQTASSRLTVDTVNGLVMYDGYSLNDMITQHILDMVADGFDLSPIERFLDNLNQNPSNRAVEELYTWISKNGMTITDDGHLVAYKRVRDDYKSFYDGATMNAVGSIVEMPRNRVDDRSDVTCSHGLHFCSHSYLSEYHGGSGRALLLKINPADVVSIPTDYNNAKGRACKYLIVGELEGEARQRVEHTDVMEQSVIVDVVQDANTTQAFIAGYRAGYKDGRGKQAVGKSVDYTNFRGQEAEYDDGYSQGRADGRQKLPNRFGLGQTGVSKGAELAIVETDPLFLTIKQMLSDHLGAQEEQILPTTLLSELDMDELDAIELDMFVEDQLNLNDFQCFEEAYMESKPTTVGDVVRAIRLFRGF